MRDREFYKRYFAVQYTILKENEMDLPRIRQIDMALQQTEQVYYADLERMVMDKDFGAAYGLVSEFKAFLEEVS